ncbi:MAG: VOC family protein [Actinomycetota bacterium]|nr:VOC family protein [Actinomycetota bacterium]
MALVSYKDLCIDAEDPIVLGAFWASTLGLRGEDLDDGDMKLSGPDKAQTIWINRVPEAKTVKHRVHLDVVSGSVDDIPAASRLSGPGEFPWTVVTDPEGGEFCIFETEEVPAYRLKAIGVDATDPASAAQWWADVMGGKVIHDDGYSYLDEIPGVPFDNMDFVPVPEAKTVKNRIHWDVTLVGGATVDDLVDNGATLLRAQDEDIHWTVMADPEGNEFCVFAP